APGPFAGRPDTLLDGLNALAQPGAETRLVHGEPPQPLAVWRLSPSYRAVTGRRGEVPSRGPAGLTLALAAADHALAPQVVARLGHDRPLAGGDAVVEAEHHPVARQAEAVGQRGRREGGPEVPVAAPHLQDGDLAGVGARAVPGRQAQV